MAALILDERLLGAIPSPFDPLDFPMLPLLDTAAPLPSRFVSPLMPPVGNQGNTGRCVLFAGNGMKAWQERRQHGRFLHFDEWWAYLRAQQIDGFPMPHNGTTCRALLKVFQKLGNPIAGHPDTAAEFKIGPYLSVPYTVDAQKRAIMQFGPILVAHAWHGNQFRPVRGILPAPTGSRIGGHARYRFGWDDSVQGIRAKRVGCWLDRNSWGKGWPGSVNGNSYDAYEFDAPGSMEQHDAWKALDLAA